MPETLWNRCLRVLESELPMEQFNTWLRPLQAIERDGEVRLLAPNPYVIKWLGENSLAADQAADRRVRGRSRARCGAGCGHARGRAVANGAVELAGANGVARRSSQCVRRRESRGSHRWCSAARSIPAFTFDSFVEGKSNQLAQGRRHSGRGPPRQGLQPAVHLRRSRPRQDASDARGGEQAQGGQLRGAASPTCTARASSATW